MSERATKEDLKRLAGLLIDHCGKRMASDDPEDRSAALVTVYRQVLADYKIRAMARLPAYPFEYSEGADVPFRMPDDDGDAARH